jgi:DNA polymerase
MKKVKDAVLKLTKSPLYDYRIKNNFYPVIGEGNHDATIMFIGEAPGLNEAKTARPFVGAAGKFLNELLESVGIKREDVYITNIVKDRPPENRDPTPQEIELYAPFLEEQINIIQPKIIATLGRFSMVYIMEKFKIYDPKAHTISKIHGQQFIAKTAYGEVKIVPLYHPAVALYNGGTRETLKKDFEILTT